MVAFAKPTVTSLLVGFIIALLGELIRLWGVSWAGSETRTTGSVGGSFLIVSGPFAHVRNPLYVGNMMLYLGIGIMSFALFPYLQVAALIFFAIQYYFIVIEEEKYLKETFGEAYDDYATKVPRFFMKVIPYKPGSVEQPDYEFKKGLLSEKRTLQAFGIVTIILIIIWTVK